MKSDIEIAREAKLLHIRKIGEKLCLKEGELELYGNYKAKITKSPSVLTDKLVLVTAINPTAFGEGKTTTSIGLADGLSKLGKKVCLALREPSLGPVFGIKGGATGGGMAQIAPMEDINLHFTGDMHAITTANNLISALIDNHIMQGNELNIDPDKVVWKRCMDMNDRALRYVQVALGGEKNGVPRNDGFNITAASEIMAILCLAADLKDLKKRIGDIIIAYDKNGSAVTCRQLGGVDAVAITLKDALKPNLVQTLEGTPAIVHGGPFANIAHGCNSVIATRLAMSVADYVVTEAGFGADLGAEKFLDIKCRLAGIKPKAVVLVATVRALKYNGGISKEDGAKENLEALEKGLPNLVGHIRNLKDVFKVNVAVAINKFVTDTDKEIDMLKKACENEGAACALCECWSKGGDGSIDLAKTVLAELDKPSTLEYTYDLNMSVEEKIFAVANKVYGAAKVEYSEQAKQSLAAIVKAGKDKLPICIAKTQYSFSDDAQKLGRPTGFTLTVRDIEIRGGAGFLVVVCGNIMLMPGLSKRPSALGMTIDDDTQEIRGLF
ncbi:MAG: formate--tetrahydrofolate ligase [Clostridia bacterium]|nr:formate--tetrahydrofolate ligase [Clostridia bacterium]MDE7328168.1 formate--tetrahydrofolate ligase [Clostridia bacterium]